MASAESEDRGLVFPSAEAFKGKINRSPRAKRVSEYRNGLIGLPLLV